MKSNRLSTALTGVDHNPVLCALYESRLVECSAGGECNHLRREDMKQAFLLGVQDGEMQQGLRSKTLLKEELYKLRKAVQKTEGEPLVSAYKLSIHALERLLNKL
jgi:hypothetical protein